MGKSTAKKEKAERINALRKKYDDFLDEDRKRKERNEDILGRLDKMRSVALALRQSYKVPGSIPTPRMIQYNDPRNQVDATMQVVPINKQVPRNVITSPLNLDEHDLMKKISEKYILIPRLTTLVLDDENKLYPKETNEDDDWTSKYDILHELKNNEKGNDNYKNKAKSKHISFKDENNTNTRSLYNLKRDVIDQDYDVNDSATDVNTHQSLDVDNNKYKCSVPISAEKDLELNKPTTTTYNSDTLKEKDIENKLKIKDAPINELREEIIDYHDLKHEAKAITLNDESGKNMPSDCNKTNAQHKNIMKTTIQSDIIENSFDAAPAENWDQNTASKLDYGEIYIDQSLSEQHDHVGNAQPSYRQGQQLHEEKQYNSQIYDHGQYNQPAEVPNEQQYIQEQLIEPQDEQVHNDQQVYPQEKYGDEMLNNSEYARKEYDQIENVPQQQHSMQNILENQEGDQQKSYQNPLQGNEQLYSEDQYDQHHEGLQSNALYNQYNMDQQQNEQIPEPGYQLSDQQPYVQDQYNQQLPEGDQPIDQQQYVQNPYNQQPYDQPPEQGDQEFDQEQYNQYQQMTEQGDVHQYVQEQYDVSQEQYGQMPVQGNQFVQQQNEQLPEEGDQQYNQEQYEQMPLQDDQLVQQQYEQISEHGVQQYNEEQYGQLPVQDNEQDQQYVQEYNINEQPNQQLHVHSDQQPHVQDLYHQQQYEELPDQNEHQELQIDPQQYDQEQYNQQYEQMSTESIQNQVQHEQGLNHQNQIHNDQQLLSEDQ